MYVTAPPSTVLFHPTGTMVQSTTSLGTGAKFIASLLPVDITVAALAIVTVVIGVIVVEQETDTVEGVATWWAVDVGDSSAILNLFFFSLKLKRSSIQCASNCYNNNCSQMFLSLNQPATLPFAGDTTHQGISQNGQIMKTYGCTSPLCYSGSFQFKALMMKWLEASQVCEMLQKNRWDLDCHRGRQ